QASEAAHDPCILDRPPVVSDIGPTSAATAAPDRQRVCGDVPQTEPLSERNRRWRRAGSGFSRQALVLRSARCCIAHATSTSSKICRGWNAGRVELVPTLRRQRPPGAAAERLRGGKRPRGNARCIEMSERRNGERVWDIIEKVGVCMLTTQVAGRLRARPIEARPDRKLGLI